MTNNAMRESVKKRQLGYKTIGEIAIEMAKDGKLISISELNNMLTAKGLGYRSSRGLAKAISTAYLYWLSFDETSRISEIIANTFVDRNGEFAWKNYSS